MPTAIETRSTGGRFGFGGAVGLSACGAVGDTAIPDMPRTLADPIRLGFARQRIAHPAPDLGEHSEQVLREAGMSAQEVEALKTSGALR